MENPFQPLRKDQSGVTRFKENKIVRYLLDAGPFDMNALALMQFNTDDRQQFAQLIGYSVSGYGDLDYVSDEMIDVVDHKSQVYALQRIDRERKSGE